MKSMRIKDSTHRALKIRASQEGKSMIEILDELLKKGGLVKEKSGKK